MTPVGGPRHYDGSGLGQISSWKCPSCGAEQSGRMELGCQISTCRSGSPGKHIGHQQPPPAAPIRQPPPAAAQAPSIMDTDAIVEAFEQWYLAHETLADGGKDLEDVFQWLRRAFKAGWEACAIRVDSHTDGTNRTDVHRGAPRVTTLTNDLTTELGKSTPLPFPVEGKVGRTVLAALRLFQDQVLINLDPEEFENGEWCSVAETTGLIDDLERVERVERRLAHPTVEPHSPPSANLVSEHTEEA